ncbi:hypothetical protein D9M70_364630 [compost metagenome]
MCLANVWQCGSKSAPYAIQIDIDDAFIQGRVNRGGRCQGIYAGIGDNDIDAAEVLTHFGHDL